MRLLREIVFAGAPVLEVRHVGPAEVATDTIIGVVVGGLLVGAYVLWLRWHGRRSHETDRIDSEHRGRDRGRSGR